RAEAAPAAVIVYPGGTGCTTTLQACLDNAPNGSTIRVQAGTYLTNGLTLDHPVSLTGASSATVILHALAHQRVLTATGAAVDSSVAISGLTLAGGNAPDASCPAGCGGALMVTGTAQPRLVNLTVRDSQAGWDGGGIFANLGSVPLLWNVDLLSNTS